MHETRDEAVEDELYLVDERDQVLGSASKSRCHDGEGLLHRAFSVFIFDARNRLLLQRRAAGKRLWPHFWSNSCCSHPRHGESLEDATLRRIREELGMQARLEPLYAFQYHARFGTAGSEHELCHVFFGKTDAPPVPWEEEIAAIRWVDAETLTAEMATEPERFTPWFQQEWQRIRTEFWQRILDSAPDSSTPR